MDSASKVFVDTDTDQLQLDPGSGQPASLYLKHGSDNRKAFAFCSQGQTYELAGSPIFSISIKPVGVYDADPLAAAINSSFTKVGIGAGTVYIADINVNVEAVRLALGIDSDDTNDKPEILAQADLLYLVDGRRHITRVFDVVIANNVTRDTDVGPPTEDIPNYPAPDQIELIAHKGQADGYCDLDGDALIPTARLPMIPVDRLPAAAFGSIRVDDEEARLALTGMTAGEVVFQAPSDDDPGLLYRFKGGSESFPANWELIGVTAVSRTQIPDFAHASTHKAGGSDAIAPEELGPFTDVVTGNASTLHHGYLPKLPGNVFLVLKGDGTWGMVTASSSYTVTTASFVDPLYGATRTISVLDSTWASVGQSIFIPDTYNLYYLVTAVPSGTSMTITPETSPNIYATTPIPSGKSVSPAGRRGRGWNYTDAAFTVPAVGSTVNVTVREPYWAPTGLVTFLGGGAGYYEITAGVSAYVITLKNLGGPSNAVATTVIATKSLMIPAGKPGVIGVDGKSAYQLAVDAGFVGSEAAWLASLHGADGTGTPSSANPIMDGAAAPGVSTDLSRADHVHPSDTSRAALASPTFTGTPLAPTAAAGTNTTQLATTAFVKTGIENALVPVWNEQTGTTYTLLSSDHGKNVRLTNASAIALTAPVLTAGFWCNIIQGGAGKVTIGASGTTLEIAAANKRTSGINKGATIAYRTTTNVWADGGLE